MKKEEFAEVLGEINENYVKDAQALGKGKKPAWLKWGAAAACLCFVAGLVIPALDHKGRTGERDPLRPLHVIEYNGACYEGVDMTDTKLLDAFHLPHEITSDMIGASLGSGLGPAGEKTEQTFYQYTPYAGIVAAAGEAKQERAQRAVYIVEDGGAYSFALFCSFIGFDANDHTEASEMFVVYGVDEAEDIASITIGKDKITDADQIRALFDNLNSSCAMGNDDYQNAVFKGMSEEKQQALDAELADSRIEMNIETAEGIAINNLCYYPTIDYVYWALNYYKLDTPIA